MLNLRETLPPKMFEILIGRCPELQANIGRFIFQLKADKFYPTGYNMKFGLSIKQRGEIKDVHTPHIPDFLAE